jgi:predicted Rossmann-fold nucleotide-binding protein
VLLLAPSFLATTALKPVVIVNTKNYWDHFISMMHHAMEENFMNKEGHNDLFTVAKGADDVLDAISSSKHWTSDHAKHLEELLLPAGYHEQKKAMADAAAEPGAA